MKIGDEVLIWNPTYQRYSKGVVKDIYESKRTKGEMWVKTYPCGILNRLDSFDEKGVQRKWRYQTQAEFYAGWSNPD